jgi:hypothetical protein
MPFAANPLLRFEHLLMRDLKIPNLRALRKRMTLDDLYGWIAFYEAEQPPESRPPTDDPRERPRRAPRADHPRPCPPRDS